MTPPDFEAPSDSDANNVYLVTLQASDGSSTTALNLSVTVTSVGPDGFRVVRVGTGFSEPVQVVPFPDGRGRVLVVERTGRIRLLNPPNGATALYLDLSAEVSTDGERGLLGVALSPTFYVSGYFYVLLTNRSGDIEVRRYRGDQLGPPADPKSANTLLVIPHGAANNHNGGWIGFGPQPDNLLYIAVGDGGSGQSANAQNRNVLLGKILRIDVNGLDDFPADPDRDYVIPPGNPFAAGGGAPEIWAYGLRNPFRASFDALTNHLWIGDVGEGAREEIDMMRLTDGGANFGWNVVEGTMNVTGPPQAGFTAPVAEYAHGTGPREGNSVIGGYVYRGPVEALQGQYIFADFVRPNIWSFPISRVNLGTTLASSQFILRNADFTPNLGSIDNVSSFGLDQFSNLYIADYDGDIFRIEAQ